MATRKREPGFFNQVRLACAYFCAELDIASWINRKEYSLETIAL